MNSHRPCRFMRRGFFHASAQRAAYDPQDFLTFGRLVRLQRVRRNLENPSIPCQAAANMLDQKHLAQIGVRHKAYATARQEVITLAGAAQGASKRAIFALHRDDAAGADALFSEADKALGRIRTLAVTVPGLEEEGSFRAALEEYSEAALYRDYVKTGAVSSLAGLPVALDDHAYLGGLSDLTGELQRRQVKAATEGNGAEVERCAAAIQEIVEALLAMDLGGYLRTKFDQAKNNLRRAEDVLYEFTLRRK